MDEVMGFHGYMISYMVTNINDRSSVGRFEPRFACIRAGRVKIRME